VLLCCDVGDVTQAPNKQSCILSLLLRGMITTAPWPVVEHLHYFLQWLGIQLPTVFPIRLSQILPWHIICLICKLKLIEHPRGTTSDLTYHEHFMDNCLSIQTTLQCVLMGYLFNDWQVVFSYVTARYYLIISIVLTAFSPLNYMLYTELSCSSGVTITAMSSPLHRLLEWLRESQ
jgi:hypothetical protein